ncbi:MAG TPA: BON domain-containing protein [Pirellulales bacterium]|nr:BON domain-containing protein [Pirellulales bacterium]
MISDPGRNQRSQHASNLPARRPDAHLVGLLAADDHRRHSWAATEDAPESEDRELERRVKNFLAQRSIPGLRRLTVEVDGHSVLLRGHVRTYYEKQLAVNCCQRVAGVLNVIDWIEVSSSD